MGNEIQIQIWVGFDLIVQGSGDRGLDDCALGLSPLHAPHQPFVYKFFNYLTVLSTMSFPPLKNNNLYAQWNEYLCLGAIHKDDELILDDHIELAGWVERK